MIEIIEEYPGENRISVSDEVQSALNGRIEVRGKGNFIKFRLPRFCRNIYLEVSGGNHVDVGEECVFHGQSIHLLAPGRLCIGSGCGFNGHSSIQMHETADIVIGRDCLFAGNVMISSSHVHKIYDIDSGERLNPPGDIRLNDHVWVSEGASLWGGAVLGGNSIVGKDTYVSKAFPANCIIAGNPARVIRERVTWKF